MTTQASSLSEKMFTPRDRPGKLYAMLAGVVCVLHFLSQGAAAAKPNIVVIMADDMGWYDVGFRNPVRSTPNIDKMANEGVNLTQSYMAPVCTPSRAAFMTGKYPFKIGLQSSVLSALENNSMPIDVKLLSESLQDEGYMSHFVGKWHLGFCNLKMTPTNRGFNTFYGMYLGKGGHYDHISKYNGYDVQNDTGPNLADHTADWGAKGKYSSNIFSDAAIDVVNNHDKAKPLFLVLSYQAVHGPIEVPQKYIDDNCANFTSGTSTVADATLQKKHCAMGAAMDEGIGNVTAALKARGLSDNLITLFVSDNGGPVKHGSSNWPLRGAKITLWEGGTRVTTILHSTKHLTDAPYTWDGMMHAVDWYPTLMKAAGSTTNLTGIDGVDNWQNIVNQNNSSRTEFVYNIDDVKDSAAIRVGRYKLIKGKGGKPNAWYNPPKGSKEKKASKASPNFWLFDLEKDPNEETNLSGKASKKATLKSMKAKLKKYKTEMVASTTHNKPDAGKPKYHNGTWHTGWC